MSRDLAAIVEPTGTMKDIKLFLLRHRHASPPFTTLLLVFTVNPSIPRESIDFLAGYEVRRPSFPSLRRRRVFKSSLFLHACLFARVFSASPVLRARLVKPRLDSELRSAVLLARISGQQNGDN